MSDSSEGVFSDGEARLRLVKDVFSKGKWRPMGTAAVLGFGPEDEIDARARAIIVTARSEGRLKIEPESGADAPTPRGRPKDSGAE